jgi:hypothetical protein
MDILGMSIALLIGALTSVLSFGSATPARADVISNEFFVDAASPGVKLFVRNKRTNDTATLSPDRTVLFVHGLSFPSESNFDLALNGFAWMDFVAKHG